MARTVAKIELTSVSGRPPKKNQADNEKPNDLQKNPTDKKNRK